MKKLKLQGGGDSPRLGPLPMKVTYDPATDTLRILRKNAVIDESDEEDPGFILD